jgi:hypothetical protein
VRFTLRDLLWLTVTAALLLGWLVDHRLQVARYAALWNDGFPVAQVYRGPQ